MRMKLSFYSSFKGVQKWLSFTWNFSVFWHYYLLFISLLLFICADFVITWKQPKISMSSMSSKMAYIDLFWCNFAVKQKLRCMCDAHAIN